MFDLKRSKSGFYSIPSGTTVRASPRTLEGPKYCRLLKRNTNILVTVLRPQWRPPMRGRVNFDHFLRRMLFWREQSLLQKVVA